MKIVVARSPEEMGEEAAQLSSEILLHAIEQNGIARIATAAGASQTAALAALSELKLPWEKIELFQLCERIDAQGNAVSRKALRERFAKKMQLKKVHYAHSAEEMNRQLGSESIDLILMGLGDKGQIGFNSAPADFDAAASYIKIDGQQGDTLITMTVRRMLRSRHIIVCAPYEIHARNVWQLLISPLNENFPASALKRHPRFTLLLDRVSAQHASPAMAARYTPELTEFEVIGDADWVK